MIKAPTHDLSYDPVKEAARLKNGDILEGYRARTIAALDGAGDYRLNEVISSPRTGFVHVTGVPILAVRKIKRLAESHQQITGTRAGGDLNIVTLLKRKWGVDVASIPLVVRQQFIADKEITFTWTQVKNFIRNKPENRIVTDADIA